MHRRYGVWLITCPRALDDRRIRNEGAQSIEVPALFQRRVGVKYEGKASFRFPNSSGGYGEFGLFGAPKSIAGFLNGFFMCKRLAKHRVNVKPGHKAILHRATGYIVLSAPRLKYRSLPGLAHFIATLVVSRDVEP